MTGKKNSRRSWQKAEKKKRNLTSNNFETLLCPEGPALAQRLWWYIYPSPPVFSTAEVAVKGAAHRRFRRLAHDGLPQLCYFPASGEEYILQSRPSQDWERACLELNFLIKISEV